MPSSLSGSSRSGFSRSGLSRTLKRVDLFLVAILAAAVLASVIPATGNGLGLLSQATTGAVAVLFVIYGARLSPREALAGLRHWRLQGLIVGFTFVVFPLIGIGLHRLTPGVVGPGLALGLLWLTLVPSTVQSSINFTSIARGNVAGALVSASLSNLLGVVVTPLLAVGLMGATGGLRLSGDAVLPIVGQILVPFILGQLSRRWTAAWVADHSRQLKWVEQATIVLVVYTAFSAGMRDNMWRQVKLGQLVVVLLIVVALLAFMLWFTWWVASRLHFDRGDRIAIQFCGTKKSLASGLPMATVLFAGAATPIGVLVLPLMLFHQVQLMACGALAARYGREVSDATVARGATEPGGPEGLAPEVAAPESPDPQEDSTAADQPAD